MTKATDEVKEEMTKATDEQIDAVLFAVQKLGVCNHLDVQGHLWGKTAVALEGLLEQGEVTLEVIDGDAIIGILEHLHQQGAIDAAPVPESGEGVFLPYYQPCVGYPINR